MPEFQQLFDEVLKQKTGIDEGGLKKLIEEKKEKVGGGYLTDQGSLFLVASDLGVSLDKVSSSDLTLNDLYIGANEITVTGKVFAVYPTRKYKRKDGEEGQYRRLVLYDSSTFAKVTLWDDKADLIDDRSIEAEAYVRVVKGYVKSGLDGSPVLNLGRKGQIELIDEEPPTEETRGVDQMTKDVSEVQSSQTFLTIKGVIRSDPRYSKFTKKDGKEGSVTQLYLEGANGRERRVVLWDHPENSATDVSSNSVVRLTNLRSKVLENGEIEFHGDESTTIVALSEVTPDATKKRGANNSNKFRLLAKAHSNESRGSSTTVSMLVVDNQSQFYTVSAEEESASVAKKLEIDSLIICDGRNVGGTTIVCKESSSIGPASGGDEGFPKLAELFRKLDDVREDAGPVFAEAIALSKTEVQELENEDGSTVERADVLVGDSVSEAKLVAWRDSAKILHGILPGQRLRLFRVIPLKGAEGPISLEVKSYSQVEKV